MSNFDNDFDNEFDNDIDDGDLPKPVVFEFKVVNGDQVVSHYIDVYPADCGKPGIHIAVYTKDENGTSEPQRGHMEPGEHFELRHTIYPNDDLDPRIWLSN